MISVSCTNGQKEESEMKYKHLSEEDKSKFREQLKSDSEKEFDAEFIRTTNLERQLINVMKEIIIEFILVECL